MLPDPDIETHERLLATPDVASASSEAAAIMSAVVAFLVGSLGADEAAATLRRWADEIQASKIGSAKQ